MPSNNYYITFCYILWTCIKLNFFEIGLTNVSIPNTRLTITKILVLKQYCLHLDLVIATINNLLTLKNCQVQQDPHFTKIYFVVWTSNYINHVYNLMCFFIHLLTVIISIFVFNDPTEQIHFMPLWSLTYNRCGHSNLMHCPFFH